MIGADEVREAGRLVHPLGGAHDERHALEVVGQRSPNPAGRTPGWRRATNSAPTSPRDSSARSSASSASLPGALIRRPRQIDGRAVGADRLVDEVAERLDADVLAARDHQTAAARGPEPLGDRRRAPASDGDGGESVRGERRAGPLRDLRGQMRRDVPDLAGRDAQAPIGVRSGQRQPRLDLDVIGLRRRRASSIRRLLRIAARVLDRRDPGAQEIGVEADDDVGLIEVVLRHQARAVRPRVRVEDRPTPKSDRR